ncbi:MAG: DUF4488 domain-containing protein [Bacteroidales bacterium]|nr:DUF4488 domain-containing protein [Bacteroidales bacterium]MDD4822284.1 DUF4488 domain-containing protein [Bacteroidales bacterium]
MKKSLFTIALLVVTCMAFAQKEFIESKSLVGVWQLTQAKKTDDGQTKIVKSPAYKVLNTDNTFIFFSITSNDLSSTVSHWGTYKITSDSTYSESVTRHYTSSALDKSESQMRFKLLDENALLLEYYNDAYKQWIPELWVRVTPRKAVNNIN